MELFTLTSRFFPRDALTEFTSVIWTERYASAGDVQLVVRATPEMAEILAPGTFLGLRGTKEVMMLATQSVENELLTVTGESLPKFLAERAALFISADYSLGDPGTGNLYGEYGATTTAGQLISSAVYRMVINPMSDLHLDWDRDKILGLELGHVDDNGTPRPLAFPLGPLYDGIQSLASAEGVGFKLYLESAKYTENVYVLKFATYRGRNRTSEQDVHSVVRLSPQLDSLTDVKEVTSISEYKNVIYVSYKDAISAHYINPDLPIPTGFDRRILFVEAEDLYFNTAAKVTDYRAQVAKNALANHIYVQLVDGQVSPHIDYKFGEDYYLGDIVELQGFSGLFSKARITEYIRSQDQFGVKEYPTLAVIDPLQTGYLPDTEPHEANPTDPDDTSNFSGDSDFDLDIDPSGDDIVWDPDPDNGSSTYDPEHDPNRRKSKKKSAPHDPNPDPEPSFGDEGNGPGGGDGTPGRAFIVLGFYPDQNNGEAVGYLDYGGGVAPVLRSAFTYTAEDPGGDTSWLEVLPHGWTLDHKQVIVRSQENKSSTFSFPWQTGYAFWAKDPTKSDPLKLTETIPNNLRKAGPEIGENHGYVSPTLDSFWCGSPTDTHLFLQSKDSYPEEHLYANGIYSTNPDFALYGGIVASGSPIELYGAWGNGGVIANSELLRVLTRDDFVPHMRWSPFNGPYSSPDGAKILFSRQVMGMDARWVLTSLGSTLDGVFTLTFGPIGTSVASYTTAPLPYNATPQQVWEAIINTPNPFLSGPPNYSGSTLSGGGQIQLFFEDSSVNGMWLSIDNTGITPGPISSGYVVTNAGMTQRGKPFWYMCDYYGANLEDVDFGPDELHTNPIWSPDSTKIHALAPSADGVAYCRWMNYDVSSKTISYPLDFSSDPLDSNGAGPLQYSPVISPNSQKIAFILVGTNYGDPMKLVVANADGSNAVVKYTEVASPGQDDLVLNSNLNTSLAWSFDNTKLAIVDKRNEAPVWIIDLATSTKTKIWPGSGWDDRNDQKWIYDIQNFDGG